MALCTHNFEAMKKPTKLAAFRRIHKEDNGALSLSMLTDKLAPLVGVKLCGAMLDFAPNRPCYPMKLRAGD